MKFYGMVRYNPGTSQLDFGGNPDLNPDSGISLKQFYHCDIGNGKGQGRDMRFWW